MEPELSGRAIACGTMGDPQACAASNRGLDVLEKARDEQLPIPHYNIALARPQDLPALARIELAAARLLAGHAPESALAETTSLDDFGVSQRAGLLWVALANDFPVGFAQVKILEPMVAHLDEIDVDPQHGRRGLGGRLVRAVCEAAVDRGYHSVTLATFRDVPFNMPFYARLGFDVTPPGALSAALRSVIADEARRGLDTTRRVVMRRMCAEAATRQEHNVPGRRT